MRKTFLNEVQCLSLSSFSGRHTNYQYLLVLGVCFHFFSKDLVFLKPFVFNQVQKLTKIENENGETAQICGCITISK